MLFIALTIGGMEE